MAVLLFPPPPASRRNRAQPARLRRAPRALCVAFGSAERGCAPPSAQAFPNAPTSNHRSRSRTEDGCFAFPAAPCKPQKPGAARPLRARLSAPPKGAAPLPAQAIPKAPASNHRGRPRTGDGCFAFPAAPASRRNRAQPARLRRAPRASRVAFGSAERGCALPPHKPSQTVPKNPPAQTFPNHPPKTFPLPPKKIKKTDAPSRNIRSLLRII